MFNVFLNDNGLSRKKLNRKSEISSQFLRLVVNFSAFAFEFFMVLL